LKKKGKMEAKIGLNTTLLEKALLEKCFTESFFKKLFILA